MAVSEAAALAVLPPSALDLARVIGVPATLAIIRHRGGIKLYVPVRADPSHPLGHICGMEPFHRLVAHYRGEEIEVPLCRALREQEALAAHRDGQSVAQLAREHGCTERTMRSMLKRARAAQPAAERAAAARQGDLFGAHGNLNNRHAREGGRPGESA